MGQFYTDFSNSPTLTERWHTGDGAVSIQSSSLPSGTGSHAARIVMSGNARYGVSWDEVGTPSGDVEVLVKWQVVNTETFNAGRVLLHGAGDSSSESAYYASHTVVGSSSSNTLALGKYVSASSTALGTVSQNLSDDTWYWTRLQRTGTTIRFRTWADGGMEPASWDASTTDASLSSGWVGFGAFTSGQTMWVDALGVGTSGDAAPDTPIPVELAGSAAGEASTTGTLSLALNLAGQADGAATPSGALSLTYFLDGQANGQAASSGLLGITLNLAGQSDGLTATDATLRFLQALAGQADGDAATTATLRFLQALQGQADGQAGSSAAITYTANLSGQADGAATTTALLVLTYDLAGQADGDATTSGMLTVVKILSPVRSSGPPQFALLVTGPLPDGELVGRQGLPAALALSFGSQLPGGWATASIGVLDDELRRILSAQEVQKMVLPYPVAAPPFAHIEILEAGTGRVWEGRRSAVDDIGGEIRGIKAVGYGITGLRDQPMPAGRGAVRSDVLVRTAIAQAAPLIELLEVEDPGVLRDWREFAGRWPHDVLSTLTGAGNGTVAFSWTVYDRQLRFFALTPPATPHYQVPADGTVRRRLGSDEVYTAVVMTYRDLDGRRRSTGTLRDDFAIAKYGIERVYPIPDGGTMTPAAALAFARTELAKRTQEGVAVSITREWTRGVEMSWGSQTPVWRVQAGEWLQVADEAMQPITAVRYDAQAGSGTVTLGQPVATSAAAEWRRMQETIAAVRGGRNPVTGAAS